jgi:hypothetical protein
LDEKPAFDEFHLALLYPAQRAQLGIALDGDTARDLAGDRIRALAYYSTWVPDFTKQKEKRKRIDGPKTGWRTIFGWVMLLVLIGTIAFIGYSAVQGFTHSNGEGNTSFIDGAWAAATELVGAVGKFIGSLTS